MDVAILEITITRAMPHAWASAAAAAPNSNSCQCTTSSLNYSHHNPVPQGATLIKPKKVITLE